MILKCSPSRFKNSVVITDNCYDFYLTLWCIFVGTIRLNPDNHFAIFMMIFILCTIEVVIIKMITFEENDRTRSATADFFSSLEVIAN